jgi:hypothetical protein
MAKVKGHDGRSEVTDGAEVSDHAGQDRDPEHHDFAGVLRALALVLMALTPLVQAVTNVTTAAIALVVVGTVWVLARPFLR